MSEIKATKKNQASAYELEFALAGLKKELQDGATRWEEIEEGIEEAWAEITVDGRAGQWRVGGRVAGRVIVGEEMHAIPEGGKSEGL